MLQPFARTLVNLLLMWCLCVATSAFADEPTSRTVTADNLEKMLKRIKDECGVTTVRAKAYSHSVVLSGEVPRPEDAHKVVKIAEGYFGKVLHQLSVKEARQIELELHSLEATGVLEEVMEVLSKTKPSVRLEMAGGTMAIIDEPQAAEYLAAVCDIRNVRRLADPILTTASGRPASFSVGGEAAFRTPQLDGAIEYRKYGTEVRILPILLDDGKVDLDVNQEVSVLQEAPVRGIVSRTLKSKVISSKGQSITWLWENADPRAGTDGYGKGPGEHQHRILILTVRPGTPH